MAKNQNLTPKDSRRPAAALAVAPAPGAASKSFHPIRFLREVRVEARKVTWTSWRETWITSVMVAIMVILTAVFFFGVDEILAVGMHAILKLANAD